MVFRKVFLPAVLLISLTLTASSGTLTGWSNKPAATIDLTAEGTLDWAVWTAGSGGVSTIRKASGGSKISDLNCGGYDGGNVHNATGSIWTWSDGTPQATAPASFATGISHGGGASFTVPADQTVRSISIYLCCRNTVGVLTARLSDGSAADYIDGSWVPDLGDNFEAVHTLVYSADSPNQTLQISFDPCWPASWGALHLHAASLRNGAATQPSFTLPAPTAVRAVPGNEMVSFAWPRVTGAHSYNLYISTTPGSTPSTPTTTGIVAYTSFFRPGDSWLFADHGERGLTNETEYTFQLTAVSGNVESPKSEMITATPSACGAISHSRRVKILPMGNSICGGWVSNDIPSDGGWRKHLCTLLENDGYLFSFVGSMTWPHKYPDTGFGQPWNEAYGARPVAAISNDVVTPAVTSYDPDVTLLEIGTNDFAWITPTQENVQNALTHYDSLLARFYRANPDGWLLVAPILPLGASKETEINNFNAGLKTRMEALAQDGKHAVYVQEMETIPYEGLIDGVHPKVETYQDIAGIWFRAIQAITDDTETEKPRRTASLTTKFQPQIASHAGKIVITGPGITGVKVWATNGALVRTAKANFQTSTLSLQAGRGIYVVDIAGNSGSRYRGIVAVR